MEYTIIVNDRSYDLPPKTLSVVEKMDEVLKVDASNLSIRQKFEKLYGFIKNLIGSEEAKEMFGSDNLSEIDLSEVTIAVKKVIDAYDKPITDYDMSKNIGKLESLPLGQIESISKAAERMASIPGQKR